MNNSLEQALLRRKSLLRSTSLFSLMTLLSRILGFVRDVVVATFFGAGAEVDAFLVAFKIPNFMRRLFAEGAFSQAFVPVLSEYQETQTHEQTREFVSKIAGTLFSVLLIVTIVALIITPILVLIFAPGFHADPHRLSMATYMLRVTFPYLLLISLTAMAAAVLNTYGSFGVPAFTPVLLNLSIIAAAVFLSPHMNVPIEACAWGVLVAGFIQLFYLLPFLRKIDLLTKPKVAWRDPTVKRVLKLMVPALFGVSVAQINLLMDTVFASFLQAGSVSWLYYSDRLNNFPLGVFGVAIATVILPHLSRKHADKSPQEFSTALDWAIRLILMIAIPSMLGLALLAGPLLTTLFQHGKFSAHDVLMARQSLIAFSIGLPWFMLIKTLASGFYAQQDIKTPVKIGVVAMAMNTVLNLILMGPLAHAGLALATSVSGFVNAAALFVLLKRRGIYQFQSGWLKYLLQLGIANGVMLTWLLWFTPNLGQWLSWTGAQRGSQLLIDIVVAMLLYFSTLIGAGMRLKDVKLRSH